MIANALVAVRGFTDTRVAALEQATPKDFAHACADEFVQAGLFGRLSAVVP